MLMDINNRWTFIMVRPFPNGFIHPDVGSEPVLNLLGGSNRQAVQRSAAKVLDGGIGKHIDFRSRVIVLSQ